MGDSTTIALNLTFFGTLGLAFLMFLGLFLLVVLTLVLAGVGRFLVLTVQALFGRLPKNDTLPLARLTGETGQPPNAANTAHDDAAAAPAPAKPRHPLLPAARREPPVLAEDWAAAVADADARAMARARAAAPEIKVTVRELPAPSLPAAKLEAVAPLVESALHLDVPAARSFTKPPSSAPLSPLDTGSLMSLNGHAKLLKAKLPANNN
ncbi:hypothetical protein [Pseudarthrobacter sp. TAF60_1]|uniref:hypothetical protein n=1 Tax=Pseudarthrobacter sp. TAF60_1 TaxID=3233071 RepID=UPI003F951DBC